MKSQCLLDTNVIIDVLRGRESVVPVFRKIVSSGWSIFYSPVCIAEIYAGIKPSEESVVAGFFSALKCIPIDEEIGRKAGRILHQFYKSHRVEMSDALIAASSLAHGLPLWTINKKHFPSPELVFFEDVR